MGEPSTASKVLHIILGSVFAYTRYYMLGKRTLSKYSEHTHVTYSYPT